MSLQQWLKSISGLASQNSTGRNARRRQWSGNGASLRRQVALTSRVESLEVRTLLTSVTGYDNLVMNDSTVTVIDIGGTFPGESSSGADDGYDQINVANTLNVDGLLQLNFLNGFQPSPGDRFDILTNASETATGTFDSVTSLFGFGDGSLYFDIEAGPNGFSVVTKELLGGNGGSFLPDLSSSADSLGTFLNADYFATVDPSVTISGVFGVGDFLQTRGTFHFEKAANQTVTLTNGTTKEVAVVSVGASNVDAFVGLGPYFVDSDGNGTIDSSDTPSSDAVGVALTNLNLGLVLMVGADLSNPPDATTDPEAAVNYAARYLSLHATADSAAIVGTGDLVVAELRDLTVDINLVKSPIQNPFHGASVIDFSAMPDGGLLVNTGDADNPTVLLNASDEIVAARAQNVTLGISDFLQIHGTGVAFEKGPDQTVTLANGTTKEVSVMTVGASGIDAFVGLGPYFVDSNNDGKIDNSDTPSADAVGLAINDLNLGLALMRNADLSNIPTDPQAAVDYLAKYYALKATAASATLVGVEDVVTANLRNLTIDVNLAKSSAETPLLTPSVVNFAALTGGGLAVPTGDPANPSVLLNFHKGQMLASAGRATLEVADTIHLDGSIALTKQATTTVNSALGDPRIINTLTIGGENLYGFAGVDGPYRRDTNGDGVITDADTPNSNATGLALDGLTFGMALMKDAIGPNKYIGLKASTDALQLVGVDGVTAVARNVDVSFNEVSPQPPLAAVRLDVIDFTSFAGGKLAVETGGNNTIDLDFNERLLAASGDLTVNVSNLVTVDGVFDFQLSPSKLFAYIDGTGSVGAGPLALSVQQVTGLLIIDDRGLGVDLDVSASANLPGSLSITADMNLKVNTSGTEYVYQVPEKFLSRVDYSSLRITAGAPRPDGTTAAPGFYVVLDGTGTLGVANTVDVTGDVYFYVTNDELQLNAAGTMADRAGLLPSIAVAGDMFLSSAGMVGSLQMAGGGATSLFNTGPFSLAGRFQLEINTTSTAKTVQVLNYNSEGTLQTPAFVPGTISANTLRIAGGMSLVAGPFTAAGSAQLVFDTNGFAVALDATVNVGFGNVHVVGQAVVVNTGSGTVFAAQLATNVNLGVTDIGVRGAATLKINTSTTTAYAGVAANTFLVNVRGTLQVMLFKMENVDVTLSSVGGVFRIDFNNLGLDFFGFVSVNVSGFVESDGDFQVIGVGSMPPLNLGPVSFNGSVSLDLRSSGGVQVLKGRLQGAGGLQITLPWPFGGSGAGATATLAGDIELGKASASVALTAQFTFTVTVGIDIPIIGRIEKTFTESFSLSGSFAWSWGAPPIIARQEGDTVYLNMGVDGGLRGALYADLTSENYTITGSGESITVQSLGQTMNFTGVKRIIATDAGAGNDYIYVGPGISANVILNGGADNDSLTYLGTGTAIIDGGAGNDLIRGGDGDDQLTGGSGDNFIDGQGGNDLITVSGGSNTVLGGQGNDQILVLGGTNEIYGGEDDDTVTIRGGANTVYGETGNNIVQIDYSNVSIGQTTIVGDVQTDTVNVTMNSNGAVALFNDRSFSFGDHTLVFDGAVEAFNITDSGAVTKFGSTNATGGNLGAAHLTVNANAIELNRDLTAPVIDFVAPNGVALNDSLAVSGALTMTAASLTTGASGAISADSLTVNVGGAATFGAPVTVFGAMNVSAGSLTGNSTIDAASAAINAVGNVAMNNRVNVTGTMNVSAGSMTTGASGALTVGTMSLGSSGSAAFGGTINVAEAMNVTAAALSSSKSINAGSATWTIAGAIGLSSGTTVSGNLTASAPDGFSTSSNSPLAVGGLSLNGGNVNFGSTVNVSGAMNVTANSLTANAIVNAGSAGWTISGAVTLNDDLVVTGSMQVSAASFTASSNAPITAGSMTLNTTGATSFGAPVIVNGAMNVTANSLIAQADLQMASALWNVLAGSVLTQGTVTATGALNINSSSLTINKQVSAGSGNWNVTNAAWTQQTLNVGGVLQITADTVRVDREVTAGGLVIHADRDVVLNADPTVTGTMGSGQIGLLEIVSHRGLIDFAGQDFHAGNGHLILSAALGFTDTIRSRARALTAINRGTGSRANITVRELDSLNILDASLANGGAYSQHGTIDIELAAQDSLLTLASGVISTSTSGQDIRLIADDFDFASGDNRITGTGRLTIRSTHDQIDYRLGSAGEDEYGVDLSLAGAPATAHIGVRDFAAMGDDFSLVQIGHANVNASGVGNEMTFGDIEGAAALRNLTKFYADTITVSGDVQAPSDRLEIYGHRATIDSKNLHNQIGPDDSGLSAKSVLLQLNEQLQHGGWIIGQDRVNIDIRNSNGTRPYFSLTGELVSFKSDVGSRVATLDANSVIDIATNQSIQVAGVIEVSGFGAQADIATDTKLTVLEGAVIAGRDDDNVLTLSAGLLLSINPGGAVTAGARFVDVNGTPTPVQTGVRADAILNSPHELFIGGTVTTSNRMELNSGTPRFDHSDYFDRLADVDPNHPLLGHSQYGLLLTGTLTTLAADSDLQLTSAADVIIRGNINVVGANSDLLVQSDQLVYVEGFLKVRDDVRILGGIKTDGTSLNNTDPLLLSSVYVAPTAQIVTYDAGSLIDIQGASDVDLFGVIVSGGTITASGVDYTLPGGSAINVRAGQQVYLDTGLLASGTVTVTSGTPGADDTLAALFPGKSLGAEGNDRLSLVVTTAGGITTAGRTGDGSGGGITINAAGNIELLGSINAGAEITQQFDDDNNFLGETATYSSEPATLTINAAGRAFLGGHTLNQAGDLVTTGTYLRAAQAITVNGGAFRTGEGLLVHAASELTANDANGSITLTAQQDATLLGLFVAGGRIDTVRDANGGYLGRVPVYFDGDSSVRLEAGGVIEIGQDIVAGQRIDLVGGSGGPGAGPGLTVQGSGRLLTLRENSQINLNAPGEVVIQPPGHIYEISAQGFTVSSTGQLTQDVTLAITVDRVDFVYSGTATLLAADTADNTSIADLVADLQAALEAGSYTITISDNLSRIVGDPFTEFADDPSTAGIVDPDVKIKLRNGMLLFTSPYAISIDDTSANATQLGVDVSAGALTSTRLYAIDAAQPGSTVSIGAPAGPNGKLSIGGKVRAYSGINLYSGISPDGTDIDLGPTGVLETVNGSISFNAGQYGDIRGAIIAGGTGSDINLSAAQTLRIRGNLTADQDILLTAGSQTVSGQISIQIGSTSRLNSTGGGGEIVVTGHNDVVFDGVFGTGSTDLARLELNAVHGNLTIPKNGAWIESDGLIALKGAVVDVQGVVRSTKTTADTTDFEITIDASDTAIINGDLQLTGSLRINADNLVEVFNTTIAITEAGQRVVFSGGDIRFGKATTNASGLLEQQGALVTAVDRIEFNATGLVDIGSGSVIATIGDNSAINLGAGSLRIAGSLLAGATIDESGTTYTGIGADIIVNGREQVAIGGQGIVGGVAQTVGGTLAATGDITVNVHGGLSDVSFTLSPLSTLRTESVAGEPSGTSHNVTINTDQDIQIYSAIVALHSGANITLISGELIEVDGLLKADNLLTVVGGSDETGVGLSLRAFEFSSDASGNPVRVHGGTLATNPGGTISIGADQKVVLSGVVGETRNVSGATVADTDEIYVTKAGNVFVMTAINAADRIQFLADNITLAPDSVVQTHAVGGEIDLRATNNLIVSSNPDGTNPAAIQAASRIHLLGRFVSLDGQTTATGSAGDVFINAVDSVTLFGAVHADDRLSVNAGVGANWTTARLIGTVTVADLSGGDISINGGTLTSGGASSIMAGRDVTVVGATSVGDTPVAVRRPVITLTPQTIEVITGTRQVAMGSILVPEVTFVTTTTTEQVGTESVRVGSAFNTADVSLSQLGYYNPNAPVSQQVREYFIEGIDYRQPVELTNAGFETPQLAAGGYQYAPAASPWTFGNGGGGIASNGSAFNNGTAPSGSQVGFIQGLGSISRTVNVSTAGAYLIQFATKGRWAGNRNTINVLVDGVVVKTITPASDDFYSTEATGWFNLTAGSHTITFQGTITADVTSFVDSISMIQDNIDWSKAYDPLTGNIINLATSPTSTPPEYGKLFGVLSDLQQDSVLIALGYRRFFTTTFANLETHNTINGIPSTQTWRPSWYGPAVSADVVASYQASYNAGNTAGSRNDGVQRGSVTYTTGVSGTGFHFNGTSGTAVLVPNDPSLQLNSGTIDAWIKTTDASSEYHGIVVKQGEYGLYVKGGKLTAYDYASGNRNTNINVADGQWHHVAMSFRNGVANGTVVYLDGVAVLTTTTSTTQTGLGLAIGSGDSNAGTYQNFNGTIDEVRVWDRVLSASEIAAVRTPLATEITRVPVDGWRDKYVLMPTGATADILRMVSQGEPTTTEADAGNTWLDTNVKLHQIGWYNPSTKEKRQDSRAGSAWAGFTQGVAWPGAGWAALYSLEYLNGVRSVELADGRTFSYSDTSVSLAGQPTWSFDPSGMSVQYMNGQWVMAPNGAALDINTAAAANRKTADLTQNVSIPIDAVANWYAAAVPLGWHQEYLGTYQDPISYTFTATLTWSGSPFGADYDLYVIDGGTGQEIYYGNPNGTNLRLSGDVSGSSGTETISGTGIGHDANFNVRWNLHSGSSASYVNIVVSITNTGSTSFIAAGYSTNGYQQINPGSTWTTNVNSSVYENIDVYNHSYAHYGPNLYRWTADGLGGNPYLYSLVSWTPQTATRSWDQVQVGSHLQDQGNYYVASTTWYEQDGPNNDYGVPNREWGSNIIAIPDFEDRYHFQWHNVYNTHDIVDTRIQLSYQLVTNTSEIHDLRPKFETGESTVKVVNEKSVTQWQTENITGSETLLTASRELTGDGTTALQGAFGATSIDALGSITIAAGNNVAVHGVVQSTGIDQTLSVIAGQNVLVNGLVPDGAPDGTLAAISTLRADGRIFITSSRDVTLGEASRLEVNADGVVDALSEVIITAGGEVTLLGSISAGYLIQASAGTGGTGSVTGTISTELSAFAGDIVLTAGALSGNVTLTGSAVDASTTDGMISLNATAGSVSQTESVATGRQLRVRAANGVTANTSVGEYDVQNSGTGDVTLLNLSDVSFVDALVSAGGDVDVLVFGNVAVRDIAAAGNVDLQATGQLSQNSGGTLTGNQLTLNAASLASTFYSNADQLNLRTAGSGNVVVHNSGTRQLELDVTVTDGSLTVTTAGDLLVTRAISLTDSDSNDITLSSGANIDIGLIQAGAFAATEADARRIRLSRLSGALRASEFLAADAADLDESGYAALDSSAARTSLVEWLTSDIFAGQTKAAAKAEAEADRQLGLTQPIRAEGDVSLTAAGAIRESSPEDADVDLIADSLTVVSGLGFTGLETSLNVITSIRNASGDIVLGDVDSRGDTAPGLSVVFIENAHGSVLINVPGDLEVQQVSGLGVTGDVTLTSDSVLRLLPVSGVPNTVMAGHDLTLYSVGNLFISGGISAPNGVSIGSAADVKLSGTTLNLSTVEAIAIESDSSLSINGILESAKGISLISNHGDVEVIGTIQGRNGAPLESLTIIARGNLMKSGAFAGQYRFRSLVDDATYYASTPELTSNSLVVDTANQSVQNFVVLDLVPFTTTDAPVMKDPVTGLDFFRDPTTGATPLTQDRYLRYIGEVGEEFYRRTDPVTGYYPFSAFNNVTNKFVERLYSTTEDPTLGTLYAADGTTEIDADDYESLEGTLVRVTDAAIIARLLPFTLKDASDGRATGTSISLEGATIGTVSNSVTFIAQGQVRAPQFTLQGSDSKVTIVSGEDLITGNWRAANIDVQSTGLFDSAGSFIGGSITVPTSFRAANDTAPETISLTALNDITFNSSLTAAQGISLHAGRSLSNLPSTVSVTGSNGFIDLSSGEDLNVPGSLTANGPINLVSTNNRGTGGNVVVHGDINGGPGAINVQTSDTGSRIDGVIRGSGGLTLSGGGTMTLLGANTYSGTTRVDASHLIVSGSTAAGTAIQVSDMSTLSGTGTIAGQGSIETGGTLSPGNSPGRIHTGSISFAADSTFVVEIGGLIAGTEYDQVNVTGTVDLGGASLNLVLSSSPFALRKDDQFVLIRNDGDDSVIGRLTYNGIVLEEGDVIRNFLGTGRGATISYVVNSDGGSVGNDVALTIINTPPVAVDDEAQTTEDDSVTFSVLTNDTDIDNNIDPSKTINLTAPFAGILTNNHDGTFTYDPNGAFEYLAVNESATVTFDYRVIDEFDDSDVGTVTITIFGVNDAPAISVQHAAVTIDEGKTALNFGEFSDIDFTNRPTITASIGTITQDASNNGAWSWSFDSNDGPDQTQWVTVTVDDHHGGVRTTTFDLIVNNVAPTLSGLSATTISENGTTILTGTINDPSLVDSFTIDVNWGDPFSPNNIETVSFPAGTTSFSLRHQYLDDNGSGTNSDMYVIGLSVTDKDGASTSTSTSVTVNNVAPVITAASTDAAGLLTRSADKTVVLNGTFTDVGSQDTHKAIVDWGDGTPSVEVTVNAANRTFTGSHTYATGGIFKVTVTLIDDDGGTVVSTTHAVVEGIGVVDGTFYIIGTDGRDHVKLRQDDRKGTLKVDVKLNQGDRDADHIKETFVASTINRVVAFLFDGHDHYDGSDVAISQIVFGGAGNDHLSGGHGNDAIFGGAGNDVIFGGPGADILVGGTGQDKIKGGDGNDLLIGGSLDKDFNDLSIIDDIDAAMAEWATGNLADTFSFLGPIIDDDEKDDLFGEKGINTIYGGIGDKVKQ